VRYQWPPASSSGNALIRFLFCSLKQMNVP
jgi:hypothetical protein